MRHFLRDDDLSQAEQHHILNLAAEMKKDRYAHRPLDGPQTVAMLFDKSSTRTRVSFAVGVSQLGGYPLIMDRAETQIERGESIADTARLLSRMTAAIVWRTYDQENLEEMARYASVPVVNALSDQFHPCQALADWLTIKERFSNLRNVKATYVGDGANNMAQSYLLAGVTAGMHIAIAAPSSDQPHQDIVTKAKTIAAETGGSFDITDDLDGAVADANVLITDTWVSMGNESETAQRIERFTPYALTSNVLAKADPHAIVMHCLPAYRDLEIAADVIDGPQSVVWDEAENRVHAQKALLAWLLEQETV